MRRRRGNRQLEHSSECLTRLVRVTRLNIASAQCVVYLRAVRDSLASLFKKWNRLLVVTQKVMGLAEDLCRLVILPAGLGESIDGRGQILDRVNIITFLVICQTKKITD